MTNLLKSGTILHAPGMAPLRERPSEEPRSSRRLARVASEAAKLIGGRVMRIEKELYRWGIASAEHLTMPDFLGIGAMKAGTTWLYSMMKFHPELCLPDKKELHYFDLNSHRSLRYYASHFRDCERDEGVRCTGEITPTYSMLDEKTIELIRTVMPRAKILYILRDPVERAWSHARYMLVDRSRREFEDVHDWEFFAHFQSPASRNRGDYVGNLARWLNHFPAEQVFVGDFSRISEDPKGLLRQIFSFLGVSDEPDWSAFPLEEVVLRSTERSIPPHFEAFLRELYAPDIRLLEHWLGPITESWGKS